MDEQLVASIRAVGVIQPPCLTDTHRTLTAIAGGRRTRAAIAADLEAIDVLVCEPDEAADAMRSLSENLVRASMGSVDIWRATQALEKQGWTEQAVADAFGLPLRRIRQLKPPAHLPASMLTVIAPRDMPNDQDLRIIAYGSPEEQAQVWMKHKPKRGELASSWIISRALAKRNIPFPPQASTTTWPAPMVSCGWRTCSRRPTKWSLRHRCRRLLRRESGCSSRGGFQFREVQKGNDPADWKPMATIGAGGREIRVREGSGAFRVIYLATLSDAVLVLHAFQKKDQRTPLRDIELASNRLKAWSRT